MGNIIGPSGQKEKNMWNWFVCVGVVLLNLYVIAWVNKKKIIIKDGETILS